MSPEKIEEDIFPQISQICTEGLEAWSFVLDVVGVICLTGFISYLCKSVRICGKSSLKCAFKS